MRTDTGVVRRRNEDSAYIDADQRFFIVADGMGGHCAGDRASALAVNAVRSFLEAAGDPIAEIAASGETERREAIELLLAQAVRAAHDSVLEESRRTRAQHGMGTTLDVVLVVGDEAFVAHVGDGRAYLVRDGEARQATMDHTVAQVMVNAGALPPESLETSPMRSVLCNSVGCERGVEIELVHLRLRRGDRLLVCTDGLYDYFDQDELAQRVTAPSADAAIQGLIDEARVRGGHDNITGVIVELNASPPAPTDDLEDSPTTPVSVPVPAGCLGPLAGLSDEALNAIVERVLREASRPHRRPPPRA